MNLTENEKALHRALGKNFEKVFGPSRAYHKVVMEEDVIQYQVITMVGFHWRHIAVVNVKNGHATKADRYFYSTRAPEVILPFESLGKDFLVNACREIRETRHG